MVTWSDVDEAVLHVGGRRSAGKQRPMVVFVELTAALTAGMVLGSLESPPARPGLFVAVWAAFTLYTFVVCACWGYGRVTVTDRELRMRTCRCETCIPRGAVATAVHVEALALPTSVDGYLILLDAWGTPLWQSLTGCWTDETVEALLAVAPEVVTMPVASPALLEAEWPGVLPRNWAGHPRRFWTIAAGTAGVLAAGIGVVALVST